MTDDERSLMVRVQGMRQELDALTNLCNRIYDRQDGLETLLEAHYEHFLRHVHDESPADENAVNAQETRQERERHEG